MIPGNILVKQIPNPRVRDFFITFFPSSIEEKSSLYQILSPSLLIYLSCDVIHISLWEHASPVLSLEISLPPYTFKLLFMQIPQSANLHTVDYIELNRVLIYFFGSDWRYAMPEEYPGMTVIYNKHNEPIIISKKKVFTNVTSELLLPINVRSQPHDVRPVAWQSLPTRGHSGLSTATLRYRVVPNVSCTDRPCDGVFGIEDEFR